MPIAARAEKIYLLVPFSAKDRAKALGARWDPVAKKWYVAGNVPLTTFREWLPPGTLEDDGAIQTLASPSEPVERGVGLSAFLQQVNEAIAIHVPKSQWVRSEISQLRTINGGHLAFELVEHDDSGRLLARLQGFLWAGRAEFIQAKFEQSTGAHLAAGLKVLFQLSAEFTATYGLRATIEDVDPSYTLGDIEAKLKAIRDTLTQEGVINLNRSLPPPPEFCLVAVVSPQDAAGLGDFRRDADRLQEAGLCHFSYFAAKFQGQDASASLLEAVSRLLDDYEGGQRFDAVCIIRGGGSVTDLYWLNDVDLARVICRLPVPVFTGIGHERDNTILDEIAHQRCDTPSKVIGWINGTIYNNASQAIENLLSILKSAGDAIKINEHAIDLLHREIQASGTQMLTAAQHDIERFTDQIHHQTQERILSAEHDLVRYLDEVRHASLRQISELDQSMENLIDLIAHLGHQRMNEATQAIESYAREILGLSPQSTLKRGFALAHDAEGKPVTSANQAHQQRELDLEFHDGRVQVRVKNGPKEHNE